MIQYTEKDRKRIENFVGQDAATNLFILANMKNYGVSSEDVQVYGEEKNDEITGIILNYRNKSLCLYATEVSSSYIQKVEELISINGNREMTCGEATRNILGDKIEHLIASENMTQMAIYEPIEITMNTENVKELTPEHVEEIVHLQRKVFETKSSDEELKQRIKFLQQDMIAGTEKVFGILEDGKIICVSEYTAETEENAMIIGVATDEAYRQKGYASKVVKKSCDDLWQKNKKAILFYTNPAAASIYLKIGFVPYKPFYMIDFK